MNSIENRRLDIVTISSFTGILDDTEISIPNLYPDPTDVRSKKFYNKKIVFISSRVHPGETPASHVVNGFLKFITSDDPRAVGLRDCFVFKIVPMLNPDGVYRGHYRTDTKGANLNRFYSNPSIIDHPTIYAVKELIMSYNKEDSDLLYLYIDLHGHASKKGCFIYGNYMDFPRQIETCLFAKLMAMNCINFDFEGSNFSEKNMHAKDKCGLSKDGSGRVALFKAFNITRCYTLECNYNTGRLINKITSLDFPDGSEADISSELYKNGPPIYSIPIYEDVGKAIGISLLDSIGKNCSSRILLNDFELKNTRLSVAAHIADQIPFRYDLSIKRAIKTVEDLENFLKVGRNSRAKSRKSEEDSKRKKNSGKKASISSSERSIIKKAKPNLVPAKRQSSEIRSKEVLAGKNNNFSKAPVDITKSAIPRGRPSIRTAFNPVNRSSRSTSANSCREEVPNRNKSVEKESKMMTVIETVGE